VEKQGNKKTEQGYRQTKPQGEADADRAASIATDMEIERDRGSLG
jgi:hypothetical protein